jgi:hypothetical protein
MGVVGAVADDQEAEYIRNVCENEIVTGKGLLAALRYVSTPFLKLPSILSSHIFLDHPSDLFCKDIHEHLV